MVTIKIKSDKCKGCGLCVHYCPMKHLTMSQTLNKRGVYYALVKHGAGTCAACGFCFHICPDSCVEIIKD